MLGTGAPQSMALGQLGSDFLSDTTEHTGDWGIIQCISACTFTTLTSALKTDGTALMTGDLTGIGLAAGVTIYGRFSTITLASGSVIAYKI